MDLIKTESQLYMKCSWVKGVIKVLLEYEMKKHNTWDLKSTSLIWMSEKETIVDENFWKKIKEWKKEKTIITGI